MLSLAALENYNLTTVLYPAVLMVFDLLMGFMLVYRRWELQHA
jgi:hypothetical protein